MNELSFSKIQELLNQADLSELPDLSIFVLRNVMLEPIEPYLRYLAYKIGFDAGIRFGEYDNVFQEAVAGQSGSLSKKTDFVLVFVQLETLSPLISCRYAALTDDEIKLEISRIEQYVASVLSGIRKQTDAAILWHGFETPVFPSLGILDDLTSNGQRIVIRGLNEFVKASLVSEGNAYFVDTALCLMRLGFNQFYDRRYWHIGRAPFTRQALREIAMEDFKYIRSLKGKAKKCLALDCDGILWGGVIGEEGLAGIKIGQTHPGSAYREFQQEVLNLYNRGVILALCSKNNEEDVWQVFREHPEMLLREEHIATAQINWRDKAANLRQIAIDLNIGVDSLVFIDDSEFEIDLVRQLLPEVEVMHLPSAKAVEFRDMLASCGSFDTLALSAEDKHRGSMYKADVSRKTLQAQATDMESYLKDLEMVLEIRLADELAIPRIAQLTQKTNQFNLTTKRYTDNDIKAFAGSIQSDVIYARLSDRFGESGIVGVCILKYENRRVTIDTFLLSCRVLGRGVENAFFIQALELARNRGCELVIGEYYPTSKNSQVADFYLKQGFKAMGRNMEFVQQTFQYELDGQVNCRSSLFKRIVSEVDKQ